MEKGTKATVRVVHCDALTTKVGSGRRTVSRSALEPGAVVGDRYRISTLLGQGGQARVWLADDLEEQREVAFKEMAGAQEQTAAEVERAALLFRREFFAMKKLQHPGTVRVHDCGYMETGHRYITMDVVHGRDLHRLVEKRPLETSEVCSILVQIARVLSFIHARLFVHCDLKASNGRVADDGSVKVMDFGIMHQLGTPAGASMPGTPTYMAPECLRGGIVDGRTDLYALGVLGFFLATGRLPFRGKETADVLDAHLHKPPPAPSSIAPVDAKLEAIVLRLLEKDPRRRFPTAAEVIAALGEATGKDLGEDSLAARASYLQMPEVVGREEEVSRLATLLDATSRGNARALFVGAPAGVGKSRLLQEFALLARVDDLPVAVGQCRAEGLAPLAPLHQALRALVPITPAPILARYGPVLSRFLPKLDGQGAAPPPSAPLEKVELFEALSGWLRELARARTFVIAFEDLHWADSATLEHMNVVVRALDATRGLVLGTFRSDEVDRLSLVFQTVDEGLADVVELRPFSRAHLAGLVEHVLGGSEVPGAFVDNLHATTGGNAFFAMECLRALIEEGALTLVGDRWRIRGDLGARRLPRSIDEVVVARLATLAPERLTFFRRLAPAGRVVEIELLRAIADLPDDQLFPALDEGIERQFLQYAQGRYFFTHDTVRSAFYDHTPDDLRRSFHERIARAIEARAEGAPEHARAVGYHYARSSEPRRAIAPLLRAGSHAIANKAFVEATVVLEEAASLLEVHPDYPEQAQLLTSAWCRLVEAGYTSNPALCWRYAARLFDYWDASGRYEQGKELVAAELASATSAGEERRRAILASVLRDVSPDDVMGPREVFVKRAEYSVLVSLSLGILGNIPELELLMARIAADQPPGFPYRAVASAARAGVAAHTGRFASILDEHRANMWALLRLRSELRTIPRQLAWSIAMGTYVLNVCLGVMGNPLDEELRREGIAIADEMGFADVRVYHAFSQLFRASFAGDGSSFVPLLGELTEWTRRVGNPRLPQRNVVVYSAPYYLERMELDLARALVAKAVRIARALPVDRWLALYVVVYGACVDVLAGEGGADADGRLDRAIAVTRAADVRMLTFTLVYAARGHLARGRVDAARALASEALARAVDPALANPFDEILARRALADVEPGPAGVAHLERAARVAIESGNVLQDGIVHLALAERLRSSDAAASRSHLDRARTRLAHARATEWLKRLEAFPGEPPTAPD